MAGETDKKSIDEKYGILKLSRRQRETAREILGFFLCLFLFFTVPGGLIVKLLVSITVYVVLFFAQVLGNLASILAYFKWYHAAIKVADAGLAIDKYDPYCHMYKIDSLALSKQPEEARKAAITASELITEYSVIYYSHWCLVYNQGDYGTAMDLANKIVELFPDDWAGYLARATTSTCFNDKKHDQLMLADIEKVMSLNKRDQDSF